MVESSQLTGQGVTSVKERYLRDGSVNNLSSMDIVRLMFRVPTDKYGAASVVGINNGIQNALGDKSVTLARLLTNKFRLGELWRFHTDFGLVIVLRKIAHSNGNSIQLALQYTKTDAGETFNIERPLIEYNAREIVQYSVDNIIRTPVNVAEDPMGFRSTKEVVDNGNDTLGETSPSENPDITETEKETEDPVQGHGETSDTLSALESTEANEHEMTSVDELDDDEEKEDDTPLDDSEVSPESNEVDSSEEESARIRDIEGQIAAAEIGAQILHEEGKHEEAAAIEERTAEIVNDLGGVSESEQDSSEELVRAESDDAESSDAVEEGDEKENKEMEHETELNEAMNSDKGTEPVKTDYIDLSDPEVRNSLLIGMVGNANPSMNHLRTYLNDYHHMNKTESFLATKSWPTETDIVYDNLTFAIVKMFNGKLYRIFCAHTDMSLDDHSWIHTNRTDGRWVQLGSDIRDNQSFDRGYRGYRH